MLSNLNSLARGLALVLAVAALAGCATSKEKLLTHGDRTMMDIWQQEAGDGGGAPPLALAVYLPQGLVVELDEPAGEVA